MMMRLRMYHHNARGYLRMRNGYSHGHHHHDDDHDGDDDDDLDNCEDGDIYSLIGSTVFAKREPLATIAPTASTATVTTPSYLHRSSTSMSLSHAPHPIPADNSSSSSTTSDRDEAFPIADCTSSAWHQRHPSSAVRDQVARYVVECNRLLMSNNYDECIAKCRICLRLLESQWGRYSQPTVDVYHTVGQAYYQRQSYDEALVAFRTANRIDEYIALDFQLLRTAQGTQPACYRDGRRATGSRLYQLRQQRQMDIFDGADSHYPATCMDDEHSTASSITNVFQGTSTAATPHSPPATPDLNPRYTLRDDLTKAVLLLRSSSASAPETSDRIDRHVRSHRRHLQQSVKLEHEGDMLRSRGQFKAAVQKYCKAISVEEFAFGGTIGLDLAYLWRKLACIVNLRSVDQMFSMDDFRVADLIQSDVSSDHDSYLLTSSLLPERGFWLKTMEHRMPARVRQGVKQGDSYYIGSQYKESIAEYRKATIVGRYYYCDQFHRSHPVRSQSLFSSSLLTVHDDVTAKTHTSVPQYFVCLLLASLLVNFVAVVILCKQDIWYGQQAMAFLGNISSAVSAHRQHYARDALLVWLVTILVYMHMKNRK